MRRRLVVHVSFLLFLVVGAVGVAWGVTITEGVVSPPPEAPLGRLMAVLMMESVAVLVLGVLLGCVSARWVLRPVSELLDHQRVLLADASHQLRGPLTALRLRVEGLRCPSSTGQTASERCRPIIEEIDRLGTMVDNLFVLGATGLQPGETVPVEVGERVRRRVEAWEPLARSRGISLACVSPPRPVVVSVGETTVDQVLDALLDNAIKFCAAFPEPGGGDQRRVLATATESGDECCEIHVRDNGPGMSEDQYGFATRRFWRAPEARSVEGSGLGLAVADSLVQAAGGRLDILPVTPHGVAVRVRLPLCRTQERETYQSNRSS